MMINSIDLETSRALNIMRLLAVFAVVMLHAQQNVDVHAGWQGALAGGSEAFAKFSLGWSCVPLLFLVSGYLQFRKPLDAWSNIRKKINGLLMPFLIWNTLWIGIVALLQRTQLFASVATTSIQPTVAQWNLVDWIHMYAGLYLPGQAYYHFDYQLWFLRDLFVISCFAAQLFWCIRRFPMMTLAACAALYALFPSLYVIKSETLLFFVLGGVWVNSGIGLREVNRAPYWMLLPLWVVTSVTCQFVPCASLVAVPMGVLVLVRFGFSLAHTRHANTFGRLGYLSFFVYLAHEYTLSILETVVNYAMPNVGQLVLAVEFICYTILIFAFCLSVGWLLRRYCPKVLSLLTGGR